MSSATLDPRMLAAAAEVLRSCAAVEAAYLLGSAAAGRLRADSDVDIAILPRHRTRVSLADRLAVASSLAVVFGRPVDVGVLCPTNVVYAKEAVATGTIVFERDHATTARFEMLTLSMYAALQEARREVLRAYAA